MKIKETAIKGGASPEREKIGLWRICTLKSAPFSALTLSYIVVDGRRFFGKVINFHKTQCFWLAEVICGEALFHERHLSSSVKPARWLLG